MNKLPNELVDVIYSFVHKSYTQQIIVHLKRIFNQVRYFSLLQLLGVLMKYNTNETIFHLMKDVEFTECSLKYPSKIKNLKL